MWDWGVGDGTTVRKSVGDFPAGIFPYPDISCGVTRGKRLELASTISLPIIPVLTHRLAVFRRLQREAKRETYV